MSEGGREGEERGGKASRINHLMGASERGDESR